MSVLLILAITLSSATLSFAMPEEEELSPQHKACLYECLRCEEMWGDNYDAHACADNCLFTNGASIDHDCTSGVAFAKRNWQQTTQACEELCVKCAETTPNYGLPSCISACKTGASSSDYTCSKYVHTH